MSTMTPRMPLHPVQGRASAWTTPRVLRTARLVIFALTALLAFVVYIGVTAHRDAVKTVGVDAAPSIIAAQTMKAEMASMDADLANELLSAAGGGGGSLNNYDAARGRAAQGLLGAAQNISYEAEKWPIHTLQNDLAVYEDLTQRARDLHDALAPDSDKGPMLDAYHEAESLSDLSMLSAADDLDAANLNALKKSYKTQSETSTGSSALVIFVGLLTLGALIWTQMFLSRRMRRTLNPALLVASFLVLWLTFYAVDAMSHAQHRLKVAREDAFASIHSLLRTRAAAFEADAFESRWLLDPQRAGVAQAGFDQRARALATLPPGSTARQVIDAESGGTHPEGFTGYLADELNNITFDGEREDAVKTLAAWENYLSVDAKIRGLERSGDHKGAIDMATGSQRGGADFAFDQFDAALKDTLAINQKVFDESVKAGMSALDGIETKALIVAGLVIVLALLGLMPRIREYA